MYMYHMYLTSFVPNMKFNSHNYWEWLFLMKTMEGIEADFSTQMDIT